MSKLVVVIQCHLVMNRCSGYPCMDAFYKREGAFASYEEDVRYMPVTCGGCCGAEIAAKLENLTKHLARHKEKKEDVVVHLASCVCSDNYHRPPCPHLEYIQQIVERKGYALVLGSYISRAAEAKRAAGTYKSFSDTLGK